MLSTRAVGCWLLVRLSLVRVARRLLLLARVVVALSHRAFVGRLRPLARFVAR